MSDSQACENRLLTWLHDDFLSGDVESRDDKSSSTSEASFRSRSTATSVTYLCRLFCFLLSRKRSLFGDAITIHRKNAERMDAYRIGLACRLGISSARYFIRLYIVVLLTRRSATSVTERVSRDTPQREAEAETTLNRRYTQTLFHGESNRRDTVLTNLRAP